MKLPNLGAAIDRAVARHIDAALGADTTPDEDFAADSRAEVSKPKGGHS
jgi:hypothetical protein